MCVTVLFFVFDDTGGSGLLDGAPPSIEEALSLSMAPGRAFHHTHWLNAGTCLECVAHPQEVAQDKAWGCQPSPTPGSTGTGTGVGRPVFLTNQPNSEHCAPHIVCL